MVLTVELYNHQDDVFGRIMLVSFDISKIIRY